MENNDNWTQSAPDLYDDFAGALSILREFKKSSRYKKISMNSRKRINLRIKALSGDVEALIALSEQELKRPYRTE